MNNDVNKQMACKSLHFIQTVHYGIYLAGLSEYALIFVLNTTDISNEAEVHFLFCINGNSKSLPLRGPQVGMQPGGHA